MQKFVSLPLMLLMNDHKIISSSWSELVLCLLSLVMLCDGEGQDSAVAHSLIPWNMKYRGEFFPKYVKVVDCDKVNLATEVRQ